MASSSVLSQTLRSITITKIKELEKQRDSYRVRKASLLDQVAKTADVRQRLQLLLHGLKDFPGLTWAQGDTDLKAAQGWLDQAEYDPTILQDKLMKVDHDLRARLDHGSKKLELAHLYSRLLTEWIDCPDAATAEPELDTGSDDSFEVLQDTQKQRLQQLREKFADVVFKSRQTDDMEIRKYLAKLFVGDSGQKALRRLREHVLQTGKNLLSQHFRLSDQALRWCVKALLRNDMLDDEKKATLKDFLKDDAVMSEIRDVLNMRLRDIKTWDWDLGGQGMPVVPRQSLNGKWRVMMDEDVLQALLTHWIGTCWAVRMKDILQVLRRWGSLWKQGSYLNEETKQKLSYFFGKWKSDQMVRDGNVEDLRMQAYRDHFFLSPLPSKLFEEAGGYDDDDDESPDADSNRKSPKEIKQLLLRTLATEAILGQSFDGEVAVVQSDFQWFAAGMPHSTVFAVLRFMGMEDEWLAFFKKALSPPMDMLDGSAPQRRKRGLPMAHIFEKLLGELVMFFMDLDVAQSSGMLLYRFHDDLWVVGKPTECAKAWQTMETFANLMGLDFNRSKTGSVYLTRGDGKKDPAVAKVLPSGSVQMNFLALDPQSGRWTINQSHVQQHVKQLQRQLNESGSVLQWIKTWNSCIGRFFSYTFGEPAGCFGPDHLEQILRTHRDMQQFMFDGAAGKTVVEHLQKLVREHFGVENVPQSFIFMPESLGGLGLKNPFISLRSLRASLPMSPDEIMKDYHRLERDFYEEAKGNFDSLGEKERRKRYKAAFIDEDDEAAKPQLTWDEAQDFISFEEYTSYRELISHSLRIKYKQLMEPASVEHILPNNAMQDALKSLKYTPDGLDVSEGECDHDALWTLLYFQEELFEQYGGVEVVDRSLLPLGVLKAMKEKKVTWQMVL